MQLSDVKKTFLLLAVCALAGCSGGGSKRGESGFNFDGSWTGEGSLTSNNLGIQECPNILLDLSQTQDELRMNVVKWACETVTRSNGRTLVFQIANGSLYFDGKWVGTITDKKIAAELNLGTTSKYEIYFDSDNELVIFNETRETGLDTWNILGLLKKN